MFSRTISRIFGFSHCRRSLSCRLSSTSQSCTGREADPAPLFFNKEVQEALELLTRIDYKKVVRKRLEGKKLQPPTYKFMTEEELQEALKLAKQRAHKRLQMPPVVKTREEIHEVLSIDEALQGFEKSKLIFTDISFGITDKDRLIVVRELDGTLRCAEWEERDRMNFIYFPRKGKEIKAPDVFHGKYLKDLMDKCAYEYTLDRACIQYEPDDPEYKRVTEFVYENVNNTNNFNSLRSTRHFGPLVFYLAWNNKIDNLLSDLIRFKNIDEAVTLIRLYHKLHPEAKSATTKYDSSDDPTELILRYAELDSFKESHIKQLISSYKELEAEKKKIEESIKKAHGISTDEA